MVKRLILFWMLIAAAASGATLPVWARYTVDNVATNYDSIALRAYWGGSLVATKVSGADASVYRDTITVDSVGQYWVEVTYIVGAATYYEAYPVTTTGMNLTQINGDATNGYNATLKLKQLDITNSSGPGINSTGSTAGVYFNSETGPGMVAFSGGAGQPGAQFDGGAGDLALMLGGTGTGRIAGYIDSARGVSTVGSVLGKVTLVDSSANDIAIVGNYQPLDSTYQDEMHDSLDTQGWAATGAAAGGITEEQMHDMLDTQSVFTASADLYPLLQAVDTIDAVGTNTRTQFVIDSAAFGTNDPYGLVNQQIIVRQDAHKPMAAVVKEVSVASGNYTITVTDSMQVAFSSGDSIWFKSDVGYDFATQAEAATANATELLATDTTGFGGDATIGGAIVSGGTGGADSSTVAIATRAVLEEAHYDSIPRLSDLTVMAQSTSNNLGYLFDYANRPAVYAKKFHIVADDGDTAFKATSLPLGGSDASRGMYVSGAVGAHFHSDSIDTWNSPFGAGAWFDGGSIAAFGAKYSGGEQSGFGLYAYSSAASDPAAFFWSEDGEAIRLISADDKYEIGSSSTDTTTNVQGLEVTGGGSCTGSGSRSVTMYARDTLNDTRVSGVDITMTSGATRYYGTTSTAGSVVFSLDDGTWVATANDGIRSYVPRSVVVNGTEVDSVNGGGVTVVTPGSAGSCTVYGYLKDLRQQAVAGAIISLTLVKASDTLNYGNVEYVAVEKSMTARTNASGYWEITNVIPNSYLDANSKYLYKVEKVGLLNPPKSKEIVVPDSSSVSITTLLGD